MPELPEVQTDVNELKYILENSYINHIEISSKRLVQLNSLPTHTIDNWRVDLIYRRGKYIIIEFENKYSLIVHLRMTGKFIERMKEKDQNYLRASIRYNNNKYLYFIDVRQFGTFELVKNIEFIEKKLGPEPLSDNFTSEVLKKMINKRKSSIKSALLDQSIVAGIGNIYADESLFLSKIRPDRLCNSLSDKEIIAIVKNIKLVLQKSIDNMGTTLSDYRTTKNISGENQYYLFIYGRTNQNCKVCGSKIDRIKLVGRSTHYCKKCQK